MKLRAPFGPAAVVVLLVVSAACGGSMEKPQPATKSVATTSRPGKVPCTATSEDVKQVDTRLGRWVLGVLSHVGAPEGEDLQPERVSERQGEFFLDLPGYADRFELSALAEPPDLVNVDLERIPVLDQADGYRLHGGWVVAKRKLQRFVVAGPDVWVTMHVFPIRERIGREAVVEWFRRFVQEAARTRPPECVRQSPAPAPGPSRSPLGDEPEHTGRIPVAFYPSTYREGDRIVMPVTFVDGTRADVLFRDDLRPHELGTYGEIAAGLRRADRSIYFRYGSASEFKGSAPLASYQGRSGATVEEWEPPPDTFACPNLVFRFGDWFVGVRTCQDELSQEEKAEWAQRLVGRQTQDGFLLLEAIPPLTIAQAGEHGGPQLWLQGPERGWPFLTLTPGPCAGPDEPAANQEIRVMPDGQRVSFARIGRIWYADWCEDGAMRIGVESPDRDFVEGAAEGIRVRDISPGVRSTRNR